MKMLATRVRTGIALGPVNIARAIGYRAGLKTGLHPVLRIVGDQTSGDYFRPPHMTTVPAERREWRDHGLAFGRWPIPVGHEPPDWFASVLDGRRLPRADRPWWKISDFSAGLDIKTIWELSRFDWTIAFAQHARTGRNASLRRLNDWLDDWARRNPPYCGPNWKCGQEASIRVLHLAATAIVLDQVHEPSAPLVTLLTNHLRRIAPTIGYAISQNNNHATSEATALFVGGSWLASVGVPGAAAWASAGRRWLEERVGRLVAPDGSFSQYSVNYHRLLLDTLSFAELWRRRLDMPRFSERYCERAKAAALWLHALVEPSTGEAPNLGANDGARILQLADQRYRDYRTSVQLGMALFAGLRAYDDIPGNIALAWLGLTLPSGSLPQASTRIAGDGGFAVLRTGSAMALLRYPRFRYRPSQADPLHVDLWVGPANLLRDAGSYSYNSDEASLAYFSGIESHNTVQFDGRDAMPRLGRFLFGDWLRTKAAGPLEAIEGGGAAFAAEYADFDGCRHYRKVTLRPDRLSVNDRIEGFKSRAVLRWRLAPGAWELEDMSAILGGHRLHVEASAPIVRCEFVEGWESRHYLERTPLPVLEVEVRRACEIRTEYRWA